MKNFYLMLAASLVLIACGESADTTAGTSDTTTIATTPPVSTQECYAYTGMDTVRLSFTNTGGNVTGSLLIQRKEKDRNDGTITGSMKGDTLKADYRFQSEGTESVRQVAFLKRGDGFVEGYGSSTQEGGKEVFNGPLRFMENLPLQKTDCNR